MKVQKQSKMKVCENLDAVPFFHIVCLFFEKLVFSLNLAQNY